MIALYAICAAVFVFLTVIFVKAVLFVPEKEKARNAPPVSVDTELAMRNLSELIRCKTVSCTNRAFEDEGEFEKFKKLLPRLFPRVYEACIYEEPSDRSILLRWCGESSEMPTVLMAHYDVVGVSEDEWDKPAFDGIIENGVLWGRGALDTKATLSGILTAAESLIEQNYKPKRDIYFAFGGDEEINGYGAKRIVELFVSRGIEPGMVLDEGGAVVDNVFPGVSRQSALIGIAEKGVVNIEYSVKSSGGHSSAPAGVTPIDRLSLACTKVAGKPFKYKLTPPAREMFDTLARNSAFIYRLIFSNLWLFSPILNIITKRRGGELCALVRTTSAFTQMRGSDGMNVIPPVASIVSNHRIIPGETTHSVEQKIKKTVDDDKVEIRIIGGSNPSPISDTSCEGWRTLVTAIKDNWKGVIASPYLMFASSDSRHFAEISNRVYRFSAMTLSQEERALIHGNNERISASQVKENVEFYVRLMKLI